MDSSPALPCGPKAAQPCLSVISRRGHLKERAKRGFQARASGQVLQLEHHYTPREGTPPKPPRGRIKRFSRGSRTRLLKSCAAIPWSRYGQTALFVTLTYPGEDRRGTWPTDGAGAKLHLNAWRRRWDRKFGPMQAVWKQEFQRRGVVHWHLGVLVAGVVNKPRLKLLRNWVRRSWSEVVQGPRVRRELRVQVDLQRGNLAAYFAKYGASKGAKEYQHELPADWDAPGRWWGFWQVGPDWQTVEMPLAAWCKLRRWLTHHVRVKTRRDRRVPGALAGLWAASRYEDGLLRALNLALAGP